MSSLFDFERREERYAVMGNPVSHSKSPFIHAAFARQCEHKISYDAIQVDAGGLAQALGNFQAAGGKGVNITVPFKQEAFALCNEVSLRAQQARAVNTLTFRADGTRHGDNTDGVGLVRDILHNHGGVIARRRVLLLGAGGAARGVVGPLLAERPAQLVIANRTPDKALELAAEFSGKDTVTGCGLPALAGQSFDLVINATAASLHQELPPLPEDVVAPGGWCYDMMYATQPTIFMRWASEHGAEKSLDGLGMLVEQAAEAFYLWRGVRPQTTPVIAALRKNN
ncbi:MAG: shikimate dehydrogenase [Proteobacteria bacterium]|nr:shikimate dehydrogenase [Pseudomonadota bacterium]